MTFWRGTNGRLYGTIPVLLNRETSTGSVETLIGNRAPFGPIMVGQFKEERFVEKDDAFWEGHGFTITEPPILEEARRLGRATST